MRYTTKVRIHGAITVLFAGCGIKPLLPGGPVVSNDEATKFYSASPNEAVYTSPPKVAFPVLPLQAFGLQYAVDVVYVSKHPEWNMHEYARLDIPGESIWIAKDSDQQGRQTIVANRPNLNTWMPEIPAPRIEAPVSISDKSRGREIDIGLAYTNPSGQAVQVTAKGKLPKKPPAKRNGSTMGHSRDVVAAVLDIERFGSNINGSMSFDDESVPFKRILGLVPFRFLLKQTQAGIVITNFRQTSSDDGFTLIRPSPADPDWPTNANESWSFDESGAHYDNGVNRFEYNLINGGLSRVGVQQHGVKKPTLEMFMHPALPDIRRHFDGVRHSEFIMSVNGQEGHGTGTITTEWTSSSTILLRFTPTEPWWLADRPMESTIRYHDDGSVDVRTVRTPR